VSWSAASELDVALFLRAQLSAIVIAWLSRWF